GRSALRAPHQGTLVPACARHRRTIRPSSWQRSTPGLRPMRAPRSRDLRGFEPRIGCMNRRAFVAAALGAAVCPGRAFGAQQGGGSVALVTADLESHIAVVELSTGRVVDRIRTTVGPRSIESTPFGYAIVAHTSIGRVSLLDTPTLTVQHVLDGFGEPR